MVTELAEEWNAKASCVRGHELLAQVDGQGDSYYYLNNQHGDIVHITNRLGGIVNRYESDAFGHTLSASKASRTTSDIRASSSTPSRMHIT
ncbi:hypothetical protein ABEV00_10570 [Paenibacillus thiaminolyticus]|uniref:hypothetical protein n=1 Tax=Paenibacillus TaxID=44249 RepID=UPI00105A5F5F|nr:hypothetical protein [Paenibacillus dendritiformis]TDL50248.1 hypothetical protein E2R60_22105 [Paenibacillus dendritiformis]